MTAITEAVVLAGGEGRHLRPLTAYQPKPMLPVATRPIIADIDDRAVVGANATLLPGSSAGAHARVGAGVVVSGAVADGMEVMC